MLEAVKKSSARAEAPAPPMMVGQASAQCHIVFARATDSAEAVGRNPWSGCPLGQDALVPHPEQRYRHLASCEQADGGVGRGPGGPPHHPAGALLSILEPNK